jgi:hypothetical protein
MILDEMKALVTRIESKYTTLSLKFRYCTAQEWMNELSNLSKTSKIGDMYPFFFVNSMTVRQTDDLVDIGEIVIATLSNATWTAEQRKIKNFDAWLSPLYEYLKESMQLSKSFSLNDFGTRVDHLFYGKSGLYGYEGDLFHDRIDAIEIKNLKLRLYKKCYD